MALIAALFNVEISLVVTVYVALGIVPHLPTSWDLCPRRYLSALSKPSDGTCM